MQIIINDKEVLFPTALSELTLGQRIDFYNEHGKLLDEMLQSILTIEDETEKELELIEFQIEKMFAVFAFFAGCTPEAIKESSFIDSIADIYQTALKDLFEETELIEFKRTFEWNNEVWELSEPELKHGDKMSFGELIDSKQVVKDKIDQGAGKWEYILPIAAIYLRKKGEAYNESFLYENSERLELMRSLPMDIAVHVAFFLKFLIASYRKALEYSSRQEQKAVANIPNNILKDMAGSTFSKALQKLKSLTFPVVDVTALNVQGRQELLMY